MNVNELDTVTQEGEGAGTQQIKNMPKTRTKACTYVQKHH